MQALLKLPIITHNKKKQIQQSFGKKICFLIDNNTFIEKTEHHKSSIGIQK